MTGSKNDENQMKRPEDAEERFQKWKKKDPYPHISPALLNSADVHDYVQTTGLIEPYDPSLLKSSSYEAKFGSKAYLWDESRERKTIELDKNSPVELKPNSLVFFETNETFRLPYYMAIRFNLKITHVHRGLLLGTGPLVDPGFEGKLLIPIHNLTDNTYYFKGGDGFIWIEFTKISRNKIWDQEYQKSATQQGVYVPFREDKIGQTSSDYFEKANDGNSIRNAIPAALVEVQNIAGAAEEHAEKANKKVNIITVGGIVAALVAAIGFYPLITNSVSLSKDVSKTISDLQKEYGVKTHDKITAQKSQLDALKKQVDDLQNEFNRYKALQTSPNLPR